MPKPHMGYEEFRSGGLRMNSEHLQGIFNAQRNCQHGRYTAFHLHKKKKSHRGQTELGSLGSSH